MANEQLRLAQQFFFVSCSLQHIIHIQKNSGRPLADLHRSFAIQMNDTHPSIAVAEMMRLLVDENAMEWETAWSVTTHALSYTNHTLLPEPLSRCPPRLLRSFRPPHP